MRKTPRVLTLLVALAVSGALLALDSVASPVAVAAAAAAAPGSYVVPVDDPVLTDVVVDSSGRAYATNSFRNEVEILSLVGRALEAPIPVGSSPISLDLSVDEQTLYVANAESNDVSVVDLSLRREVRRIPLPTAPSPLRPLSLAVAANGTALVTRTTNGLGDAPITLSIDLTAGTVRPRTDSNPSPSAGDRTVVRASADRSRVGIVRTTWNNPVAMASFYTASTDSFASGKAVAAGTLLGVDGSGSKMLVGSGTSLLDGDLVLRATIPGPGVRATTMNRAGTRAYRLLEGDVEVIDVARGLVVESAALPDRGPASRGGLAVTPDDATLVALTQQGFSVVPVASAAPVPCPPPSAPSPVVSVCGAPLADVVVDGRGRAYASNPARNQIEVVSLASRLRETPIPVGSQPRTIDLSPDGNTLYVVDSGAEELSVVDLTLRREVRRVTVRSAPNSSDRPVSVAAANNGTALVTTLSPFWSEGRLLQLDLGLFGAIRERNDFPGADPTWVQGSRPLQLEASRDGSRIAAVVRNSSVFTYIAATDTFTPSKWVSGNLLDVAVDATGSKILVGPGAFGWDPGTYVLDQGLVRRATIPGGDYHAVNAPGTTGYRQSGRVVEVLDLARGLVARRITLPEGGQTGQGALALSPDDTTIVAATASGLSISPVSAGVAVGCPIPTAPPSVTAVCGAPLGEIVMDHRGRAFVSNPARNQIEVVSLSTGAREEPILVGSRPRGLDLSPDGTMLYVANSGAEEISVVDVARRREVRRITVPSVGSNDRPLSIAVGDRGIALFTTAHSGHGYGGRIYQLDLARETATLRDDFSPGGGSNIGNGSRVKASGDRSRIAMVGVDRTPGGVVLYRTDTNRFSPETTVDGRADFVGMNGTGSRLLLSPSGDVLNGALEREGRVPPGGKSVAVNRSGTTGYRVQNMTVEVLDLDRRVVQRSIPLPQYVGEAPGAIALSPDETTLAVLTVHGLSVVPTSTVSLRTPYSVWVQPTTAPLDGVGNWTFTANEPMATAGQASPSYFYGHHFSFTQGAAGAMGLATGPAGKVAVFTATAPGSRVHNAAVPFNWASGRLYFTFVYQTAPGTWGAWIHDYATGSWTAIGELRLPVEWGKLSGVTVTTATWTGRSASKCSAYPLADVLYHPPVGYVGTAPTFAALAANDQTPGDCPASTSVQGGVWARYRLGAKLAGS